MPATSLVHPTAVIDGDVHLDEDVVIGPHCILTGPVRIKSGTRLIGQNWVQGRCEIGRGNVLYPGARIGGPPQDLNFDPAQEDPGILVGDENVFREGFTAHRGKTDEPTRIGDENYFMSNTHVGHDVQISNHCTFATGVALGGHVTIADRAIIGGNTAVGQFVSVGRGAFLTGGYATSQSVPPWFTMTCTGTCGSLNVIGMRRNNMSQEDIARRKWIFKLFYRMNLSLRQVKERLVEEQDDPIAREYLDFILASPQPICHGFQRRNRGGGADHRGT